MFPPLAGACRFIYMHSSRTVVVFVRTRAQCDGAVKEGGWAWLVFHGKEMGFTLSDRLARPVAGFVGAPVLRNLYCDKEARPKKVLLVKP